MKMAASRMARAVPGKAAPSPSLVFPPASRQARRTGSISRPRGQILPACFCAVAKAPKTDRVSCRQPSRLSLMAGSVRLKGNLISRTAVALDVETNKKTGEIPPALTEAIDPRSCLRLDVPRLHLAQPPTQLGYPLSPGDPAIRANRSRPARA